LYSFWSDFFGLADEHRSKTRRILRFPSRLLAGRSETDAKKLPKNARVIGGIENRGFELQNHQLYSFWSDFFGPADEHRSKTRRILRFPSRLLAGRSAAKAKKLPKNARVTGGIENRGFEFQNQQLYSFWSDFFGPADEHRFKTRRILRFPSRLLAGRSHTEAKKLPKNARVIGAIENRGFELQNQQFYSFRSGFFGLAAAHIEVPASRPSSCRTQNRASRSAKSPRFAFYKEKQVL
jgi:hypothetical protein